MKPTRMHAAHSLARLDVIGEVFVDPIRSAEVCDFHSEPDLVRVEATSEEACDD